MKRVLIAADVDPLLVQLLRSDGRFEVVFRPVTTEAQLLEIVPGCEILVTRYHNQVTRGVLEAATTLRLVAQGTSGIDNIDETAAGERGVVILSTPGENANAVAELVLSAMISLSRTVPSYDREMKTGTWKRDDCANRRELRGRTLGIIGLGRVGSRVAQLASAFSMQVIAFDPYIDKARFEELGVRQHSPVDSVIEECDLLTVHVPATEETRDLVSRKRLASMRNSAIVINMSRGTVLDLDAALDMLHANHLGGLALDVFSEEPPARSWPDHPQLLLTPHIAGCTREAKASIARALYEEITTHPFVSS